MKQRESSFETLRITAMMMVVMLHCNYFVLGDVSAAEISTSPVGAFWRMFWDQLCTPCVNLFILISGWFGIRPKLKGGLSILFQVLFYTAFSIVICKLVGWEISIDRIKAALTGQMAYWFIWPYLLLYITVPAFNLLVETAPERVDAIILSLLLFEFALDWVVYYAGGAGGKSYIAFVTLYLIGRVLATKEMKINQWSKYTYLILFFIMTFIPTVIAYFGEVTLHFKFGKSVYTNPFVIAASVALVLYFSKIHYTNNTINWLACSAFSIYLIHMNPLMASHFKGMMSSVFSWCDNNLIVYSFASLFLTMLLGIICMYLDKIRIYIWNMISVYIR